MDHYVSVADIEAIYGVTSKSYIYKLASVNSWGKRRLFGGRVEYLWADVDRVLGKNESGAEVR